MDSVTEVEIIIKITYKEEQTTSHKILLGIKESQMEIIIHIFHRKI